MKSYIAEVEIDGKKYWMPAQGPDNPIEPHVVVRDIATPIVAILWRNIGVRAALVGTKD